MIEKCNCCKAQTQNIFNLRFEDIIGMAEKYEQKIQICEKCGFIFTGNPFEQELLDNRYKNYSKFEFDDDSYILDEAEDYKVRSRRQYQFIDRVIGMKEIESVLEVGASSGYNLSLYKKNCKCLGIEPSKRNCINAKQIYGVELYPGTFEEYMNSGIEEKFDIIFLSMVLEHIVNPVDFLKNCSVINNKYLFVEVPVLDYKYVDEPYGIFCEEHVNLFTLESLQKIMKECGYKLVNADMILGLEQALPAGFPSIATIWEKSNEEIKIHKSIISSELLFEKYLEDSKVQMKRIYEIIENIPNEKKLAVWGTGHHASMLLANTSLKEKNIVRVWDSDERKWGEKMANVEISPYNGVDIEKKKVEVVLLATYTAQKSLERILVDGEYSIEIIKLYDI